MADTELKIKVSAEATTIKELETRIRALRDEFKSSVIGSNQYNEAAQKLKSTLEQKTVAVRVAETENAKLMRSYFTLGENLRKNTNPAFVSFNQIIQDAPFGIRGVGNNIQFLTQQFTQLRSQGMSTGDILKGVVQNALTPMGALMFAVSAGTSLLTIAIDKLSSSSEKSGEKFDEAGKKIVTYKSALDRLNEQRQENKNIANDIKTLNLQIDVFQSEVNRYEALNAKARIELAKYPDLLAKQIVANNTIINNAKANIALAKKELESLSPQGYKPLRDVSTGMLDVGFEAGEMSTPKDRQKSLSAQEKEMQRIEDRRRQLEEDGIKYKQQQAEELAQIREDAERRSLKKTEDNLRSAMNLYNSVFFSPLKAGFEAIASGSGNMADAFIDSLKRMIVQLLEFAAFSAILSFIPGMGTFTSLFSTMSGLTSLATPVTTGGVSNRSTLSRISSRSMNRGGGLKVQVVGKLGNDAIYLSGNRYLSMNNAAKY